MHASHFGWVFPISISFDYGGFATAGSGDWNLVVGDCAMSVWHKNHSLLSESYGNYYLIIYLGGFGECVVCRRPSKLALSASSTVLDFLADRGPSCPNGQVPSPCLPPRQAIFGENRSSDLNFLKCQRKRKFRGAENGNSGGRAKN